MQYPVKNINNYGDGTCCDLWFTHDLRSAYHSDLAATPTNPPKFLILQLLCQASSTLNLVMNYIIHKNRWNGIQLGGIEKREIILPEGRESVFPYLSKFIPGFDFENFQLPGTMNCT
ncbi:hypothetical protein NE237_011315 [Protea cynaroides]|uniref:Uncharacterized protein n=1 Tax=Protea cynaroides TaxID=273540 RepID=A0A9Q0GUQ5_9MAGN|nr:hypothetical protein NE237_011315 [Protea cynaroides]